MPPEDKIYKLRVGITSKGVFFARIDSETHYATGTGSTPVEAVQNAAFEASMILDGVVDDAA